MNGKKKYSETYEVAVFAAVADEAGAVVLAGAKVEVSVTPYKPSNLSRYFQKWTLKRTTAAHKAWASWIAVVRSEPLQVDSMQDVEFAMNCWFRQRHALSVAMQPPKLALAMHVSAQPATEKYFLVVN